MHDVDMRAHKPVSAHSRAPLSCAPFAHRAPDIASFGSEVQARIRIRGSLLSCSRLSSQLFDYASTLRTQRLAAETRLATFEALLLYRRSAQSAFVLRHTALGDGTGRLLADGATHTAGSLASFTVVEGLGKGSFGAVFLVEHDAAAPDAPGGKKRQVSSLGVAVADRDKKPPQHHHHHHCVFSFLSSLGPGARDEDGGARDGGVVGKARAAP